jgi:polyphosphate glucokinase
VFDVVERLTLATEPDYIVMGGGRAEELDELPPNTRRGDNERAFVGGFRLWEEDWVPSASVGVARVSDTV